MFIVTLQNSSSVVALNRVILKISAMKDYDILIDQFCLSKAVYLVSLGNYGH